jgi:hypothetical protein
MSSTPQSILPCDLCGYLGDLTKTTKVICGCSHGSLGCEKCKSIDGQRNSPAPACCLNCYRQATRYFRDDSSQNLRCQHVKIQICCHCRTRIKYFSSSQVYAGILQKIRRAWETLRRNHGLVRRSRFFAMMAENWGMFSQFYFQNFCDHMMVNPWTKLKKQAFFQLWLLSQMNNPFGPRIVMSIRSNLWESYPHSPLHISSQFSWRFCRFAWVRKLISRFAMLFETRCDALQLYRQSYLHRCRCTKHQMMLFIIRYMISQHAEILALLN